MSFHMLACDNSPQYFVMKFVSLNLFHFCCFLNPRCHFFIIPLFKNKNKNNKHLRQASVPKKLKLSHRAKTVAQAFSCAIRGWLNAEGGCFRLRKCNRIRHSYRHKSSSNKDFLFLSQVSEQPPAPRTIHSTVFMTHF